RYLYFPIFSLALSFTFFFKSISRIYLYIAIVVGGLCCFASFWQVDFWSTNESLFSHTLKVSPLSIAATNGMGAVEANKGNNLLALDFFQQAYKKNPHSMV